MSDDANEQLRIAWRAHAGALADWTWRNLVNRRDVFGHYKSINKRRRDRKDTAYTDKNPLTLDVLRKHYRGSDEGDLIGLHSTAVDDPGGAGEVVACWSRWVAVDIDLHGDGGDPDANSRFALDLYKLAVSLGFEALLFDSDGRGGFHLLLVFDGPTPTEKVHAFGRWLVRDWEDAGLTQKPEVFPKQASVVKRGKGGYGNWLRLPGHHHTRSHFTRVWDGTRWLDGEEAIRVILQTKGTPADAIPKEALPPTKEETAATKGETATRRPGRGLGLGHRDEAGLAEEALEYLDGSYLDDYDEWLGVGMALSELGSVGLTLWDSWSRRSPKYQPGVCQRKWATFEPGQGRTLGSLFHWAKQEGWPGPRCGRSHRDFPDLPTGRSSGYHSHQVPVSIAPGQSGASRDAAPSWQRTDEPLPGKLTQIAGEMLRDLEGGRVSLHRAPTGSGKSLSVAQVAVERYRRGEATLIAVPTLHLARETLETIGELAPETFGQGVVADLCGPRKPAESGDGADEDSDDPAANDPGKYPIDSRTRIVVCSHAQLLRRGFSKFVRPIWELLQASEDEAGPRPAFAPIVDEATALVAATRQEIPLAHRATRKDNPDGSGGKNIALSDCPKSNRSGNCANCMLRKLGGETYFNRFGIRELGPPRTIEFNSDGEELRTPRSPLKVIESDADLGPEIYVGGNTFAATPQGWLGKPLGADARHSAEIELFRCEEKGKQPEESPNEVLAHMLQFGDRPVVTWEKPLDKDDNPVDADLLKWRIEHASKKGAPWDDGIRFPMATCEVPRLRFADLIGPEKLKRFAAENRVGIVFAGSTLTADDEAVLREVWPELVVRPHPYPERKIRQVAIAFVEDLRGPRSLIGDDGRLLTAPLEDHGLGLIFCTMKRVARSLYDAVKLTHPSTGFAAENDEEKLLTPLLGRDVEQRVLITYSRGVLGLGVNLLGIRYLVVDAKAFRAIASFTPGELTPDAFERAQAEERLALIMQNVGRAIRGEPGKTVVLIVLNADDALKKAISGAESLIEGSELPPVIATGGDLAQVVDQAARWLAAGGGEWPEPDPAKASVKRKGRPSKRTPEAVLAAAEVALQRGEKRRDFYRRMHIDLVLSKDEIAALRARFFPEPTDQKGGAADGRS